MQPITHTGFAFEDPVESETVIHEWTEQSTDSPYSWTFSLIEITAGGERDWVLCTVNKTDGVPTRTYYQPVHRRPYPTLQDASEHLIRAV